MGWRFLVPNAFTAANLGLALTSIGLSLEGHLNLAAWLIIWSALLDKADGAAARLLKASSDFGVQFDSLADLIAFGLAPAVLIYAFGRRAWGVAGGSPLWWVLVACCGLYALLAAVRLARFNVSAVARPGRTWFTGIPSTLCGGIVASLALIADRHGLPLEVVRLFPLVLVLLALGMVSSLPLPKLVRRKNRVINVIQWSNVLVAYGCGFAMVLPEYLLFISGVYVLVGVAYGLLRGTGEEAAPAA
jgi:CDP-diacylglycerol--serine O-phosphatidyltransferase